MTSSNTAGTTTTYTYDTLGNLVLEKTKNKVVDYQYNELNQLTKKKEGSESYSYTYDKRGNRTAEIGKKASRSYVYDETNRMAEGTNWKGDKSAYTYNGLGLRVNNTHTTHAGKVYARDYVIDYTSFENDDLMVFAEGNGQLEYEQKHVYAGSERIEQFTDKGNWERTLYVHEDVMGNTRYYTKANGQSFAELTYDAWGMPESPNKLLNNDHGNYVFATFTGHIYDTTLDIYFAEARFYDANNRTWLAMDSLGKGVSQAFYYLNLASAVYGVYSMSAGENSAVSSQNMMIIGANGEGYIVEGSAGTPIYLIPGTTITFFEEKKNDTEEDSETGKITSGKLRAPETGTPGSIYEQIDNKGDVMSRTKYGENGRPEYRDDLMGRAHYDKTRGEYLDQHRHTYKYNDKGQPIKEIVTPIPH